jgi:hypothetical protein
MQKARNKGDLLGNSHDHLEKICGPPCKESARPAGARNSRRRIYWLLDQGLNLCGILSGGYQPAGKMSIVDRGRGSALLPAVVESGRLIWATETAK